MTSQLVPDIFRDTAVGLSLQSCFYMIPLCVHPPWEPGIHSL